MKILPGLIRYAGVSVALAVISGCDSGSTLAGNPQSQIPQVSSRFDRRLSLELMDSPDYAKTGLYVNEESGSNVSTILAYRKDNSTNGPPICQSPLALKGVVGIAVDFRGHLILPEAGFSGSVVVTKGRRLCGAELGSFADPYSNLPEDVASNNAATGKIAVSGLFGIGTCSGPCAGGVAICTLAAGCTSNLTAGQIYNPYGVAMDPKGNCWVSAEDRNGLSNLTYFAQCAGSGVEASGFQSYSGGDGGLEIDKSGNILAFARIYQGTAALYVYSGCKPTCTLVGGPFLLSGTGREKIHSTYGHLNQRGDTLAVPDSTNTRVDVYAYTPTSLTYKYSFNNGISGSVYGTAYVPQVNSPF